ncbi:hypothetical protein KSP40_PGU018148 [Platanthera guangdongensis]|uniref:Uncharacterized protein n=1 Tax=Platanthera guangdongensis TaxID=2320717 RepID=A0ABR2MC37_9ASPA
MLPACLTCGYMLVGLWYYFMNRPVAVLGLYFEFVYPLCRGIIVISNKFRLPLVGLRPL